MPEGKRNGGSAAFPTRLKIPRTATTVRHPALTLGASQQQQQQQQRHPALTLRASQQQQQQQQQRQPQPQRHPALTLGASQRKRQQRRRHPARTLGRSHWQRHLWHQERIREQRASSIAGPRLALLRQCRLLVLERVGDPRAVLDVVRRAHKVGRKAIASRPTEVLPNLLIREAPDYGTRKESGNRVLLALLTTHLCRTSFSLAYAVGPPS